MVNANKTHITFAGVGIKYILNEISIDRDQTFNTTEYVGGNGSSTQFVSRKGRTIKFKSLCLKTDKAKMMKGNRIRAYRYIANKYRKRTGVLTSQSRSGLNGNYRITKFNYTEDTDGNYIIDWEFQEVMKFNVTRRTFRVWGSGVSSATKKKRTTNRSSSSDTNLSTNVKYLLKSCGLMDREKGGKRCVMSLQKFLQSKGYYKDYKVDGDYGVYTEKAVKSLQQKCKLKNTGKWDKATRSYFQKQYKYPTRLKQVDEKRIQIKW